MPWDHKLEMAFSPRAIAIVGASRKHRAGSGGERFVSILQSQGFPGQIYPVNPYAEEIYGVKSYPDLKTVPTVPDLVIISVPAAEVKNALADCADRGAKNIHIYTSGFGETGIPERKDLEEELRELALREGLRIIGPNCMGLHIPSSHMSTWDEEPSQPGIVSLLSQSGGHAADFTRCAREVYLGLSKVVSFGNALVLESTDFLEYLTTDRETQILCMYLEGVKDGRKLLQQVTEVNVTKPVILWKGGLTEAGAKAAASHTSSLAGSVVIWDTFFRQTGAIRVNSVEEMVDVALAFTHLPVPEGHRAAIISAGGGNAVASADICTQEGLQVPTFTEETRRKLREFVPPVGTSVNNPLDAGVMIRDLALLERGLNLVTADPLTELIIVIVRLDTIRGVGEDQVKKTGELLCQFAWQNGRKKPMVAVLSLGRGTAEAIMEENRLVQELLNARIPFYPDLPRAARALSRFVSYWLRKPR